MIHYEQCPVCGASEFKSLFKVKDYTVSSEEFELEQCVSCGFVLTQDVPDEIAIGPYYQSNNYISHSDTQKGVINKMYHRVRNITLRSKRNLVEKESGIKRGTLLDIGCGTGAFLNEMQQAGWKVGGLEPDSGARKMAEDLYGIQALPSHELFSVIPQSVDVISMWHVLEHVHALNKYLDQIKTIIRPGGTIFIAVPNHTSSDALKYQSNWAAYDVPRHLYHFSPKTMRLLLQQHGLLVKAIKPMWFDSFYVSMLSEQYKNGKGNLVAAFLSGFVSNAKALFNKERCSSVIYVIKKDGSS
jgi:2-polyprenyl-3-methyl-5-hydroxy-6-metoxy-1,4-benzoquinol methylase